MRIRELGKARRRREVVAAATSLWRDHGVDDVSLAHVADAAEVSIQTIYNLIGGADAVKMAVIEELLARLEVAVALQPETGVRKAVVRAKTSAALFTADPALYRPLLVSIPKALFEGVELIRDGSNFQREALEEARRLGEIARDIPIEPLAWQIHVQFVGALIAWACGVLDGAAFARAAELAALGPLAACATKQVRPLLEERVHHLLRTSGQPASECAGE